MTTQKKKYEEPDGGWGWFVVLAYAVNNCVTIPIMQGFNLIHKEKFQSIGISVTDATVITNINAAFGMILGLANGRLIRNYGYRKVAISGAVMYAFGVIGTAFATTFSEFIFFYGMICSYGMGLSMQSYGIALYSYFQKRRSQAVSLNMTITGLGPVFMPPLHSLLLSRYGAQGTMLILGGLSLNSLVGALLLQPVKWHAKNIKLSEAARNEETVALNIAEVETKVQNKTGAENHTRCVEKNRTITVSSVNHDTETASIYGYDIPMSTNRRFSTGYYPSLDGINLGSSINIFSENFSQLELNGKNIHVSDDFDGVNIPDNNSNKKPLEEKRKIKKLMTQVVQFFDLGLLKDPIYVNLMLGLSIATMAESNFSQLTPLILADMSLTTNQTAMVMSVIGAGDLFFRGIASFLGKALRQSFRMMCLYSFTLLIILRTSLLFTESYSGMLGIGACLGFAKGLRSVYMPLVIPDYIKSVERLASAASIQSLVNGCFLLSAGPLIGFILKKSNNFMICMGFINGVTLFTMFMWITEMIVRKVQNKTPNSNEN